MSPARGKEELFGGTKRKLPFSPADPVATGAGPWLCFGAAAFCANALLDSQGGPKAKELLLQTGEEIRSANQLLFEKKLTKLSAIIPSPFWTVLLPLTFFAQL